MEVKKTRKPKSKLFAFDEGEQASFHEHVSRIIHNSETPSDVIEGVKDYIEAEGIDSKHATELMLISSTLVMNQTFMILHNDLAKIGGHDAIHFNLVDAFISQLCVLMWSYNYRDVKFDPNTSAHRDVNFIKYINENYKYVFKIIAKWISLWFYGSTINHLMTKKYVTIIMMSFEELPVDVDLLINAYFFALHDLLAVRKIAIDSYNNLTQFEQMLRPADDVKDEIDKNSFNFDGKTFKITNQNKH